MRSLAIGGVGAVGPGFGNWPAAAELLRHGLPPVAGDATEIPVPAILNPRERRRASDTVKLALAAGAEACAAADAAPATLPAVFVSSHGEGKTTHRLMEALCDPDPLVSPTLFHNSVHNTPAGYWSISVKGHAPVASISAGNRSVSAGLLKAASLIERGAERVLLVAYDAPFPAPLDRECPIAAALAVGLLLRPGNAQPAVGRIDWCLEPETGPDSVAGTPLEGLAGQSPIGEVLPLLGALASGQPRRLVFAGHGWPRLVVDVAS